MIELLLEVSIKIDDDERKRLSEKRGEIQRAIESIDPSVGVFMCENWLEDGE